MKVLFVAADPMEFRGLLARAAGVQPANFAVDFARSARIGSCDALLVANGAGWKRAAAAVEAAERFAPEAIVSTGFCGALDERLKVADVLVGTGIHVLQSDRGSTAVPQSPAMLRPQAALAGVIASIDHVAQTAGEKRLLRQSGASAVEMEAAAVAESAAKRGVPFYCVRAVTDLAGETLANDFNRALRSDGHFDTMIILRGALRRPALRVPELFRLRSRCVRAAEALGEFFVGCRF